MSRRPAFSCTLSHSPMYCVSILWFSCLGRRGLCSRSEVRRVLLPTPECVTVAGREGTLVSWAGPGLLLGVRGAQSCFTQMEATWTRGRQDPKHPCFLSSSSWVWGGCSVGRGLDVEWTSSGKPLVWCNPRWWATPSFLSW